MHESDSLDAWFKREVLPHEAALMRFLRRHWASQHEHADIRQEAYLKMYEAAQASRPHSPKAFLFMTARNLMADRVRRRRIVAIDGTRDSELSNVIVDELSPERRLESHQLLKAMTEALNSLPARCREVVWMRRIDELSQKEVAGRLGISVRTVESHVRAGMLALADVYFGRRGAKDRDAGTERTESEEDNGS